MNTVVSLIRAVCHPGDSHGDPARAPGRVFRSPRRVVENPEWPLAHPPANPPDRAMLNLLKLACLALYALGVAALAGLLRAPLAGAFEWIAAALVVIHVLELPIVWKALRAAPGAFAAHLAQALLFGMLHSLPLLRAQRQAAA